MQPLDSPQEIELLTTNLREGAKSIARLFPTPPGMQRAENPEDFRKWYAMATPEERAAYLQRDGVDVEDVLNVLNHKPTHRRK